MTPGRFLTAAMIVFALVVVPTTAYVGGYFLLGEYRDWRKYSPSNQVERHFRAEWQATIYEPAGRVEMWLGGYPTVVTWAEHPGAQTIEP